MRHLGGVLFGIIYGGKDGNGRMTPLRTETKTPTAATTSSAPVLLITGGSSGIGLATAEYFLERNWKVANISRRPSPLSGVHNYLADLTEDEQVTAAIKACHDELGRIDVLISGAGHGISGPVEDARPEAVMQQLDVHLLGAQRCLNSVLPIMRAQKSGRVILISSVAAILAIPFQTWYSVTKAGISFLAKGLANELRPFGIEVCACQPGDTKTPFTDNRKKATASPAYAEREARSLARMEHDERHGMPAAVIAKHLYSLAVRRRRLPATSTVGWQYKLFSLLTKILPEWVAQYILYLLYAR